MAAPSISGYVARLTTILGPRYFDVMSLIDMTKPQYESDPFEMTSRVPAFDDSRDILQKPRFQLATTTLCGMTTYLSIPIWFLILLQIATQGKGIDNPAGLGFYLVYCLGLGVPLSIANAFLIHPATTQLKGQRWRALAITAIFAVAAAVLFAYDSYLTNFAIATGAAVSGEWCLLWYHALFLIPPTYFGLIVASLAYRRPTAENEAPVQSYTEYKRFLPGQYNQPDEGESAT